MDIRRDIPVEEFTTVIEPPVTVRLSHFSGWKADFMLDYTDHVYSLEQLVNSINMAGFGLGIGPGRSSGYGRYHVADVK